MNRLGFLHRNKLGCYLLWIMEMNRENEHNNLHEEPTEGVTQTAARARTLKDLVNTPLKKAMFIVQIISYILIPGSPLIGGAIGGLLGLKAGQIAGLVLGIFIAGEILFYGSLIFLGKEVVLLVRDRLKGWFKRKKVKD